MDRGKTQIYVLDLFQLVCFIVGITLDDLPPGFEEGEPASTDADMEDGSPGSEFHFTNPGLTALPTAKCRATYPLVVPPSHRIGMGDACELPAPRQGDTLLQPSR